MTKNALKKNADAPLFGEVESPAKTPAKVGRPKKTAVAIVKEAPPPAKTPTTDSTGMIALIREIAMNPSVDVEKMRAVLDMQERILDRNAKAEFDAALADMQPDLPTINQKGKIEIRAKDASGDRKGAIQQSTKFAKFEDINEALRPIIGKYGFAVSFRTGLTEDGRVQIIGILSHRAGHREQTTMVLPHDATGSKNAVQAIGSSTSYGKRYILCALLNITSRGEDDDGASSGKPEGFTDDAKITAEQTKALVALVDSSGVGGIRFCQKYGIEKIADLPAHFYAEATKACENFAATNKKA